MVKKQVDVIGRIIEFIENTAHDDETVNGEVPVYINELAYFVYNTNDPTNSQYKSVYRSVSNLEKKGILYSRKINQFEEKKNGLRYQKEICAIVKNWRVVTNKKKNL